MKNKIFSCFLLVFIFTALVSKAQCSIDNNYFQAGEELIFDLYFKFGLVNTKAGVSKLTTANVRYKDHDALKMTMIARSVGMADKFFTLSDTLSCYLTQDLIPLAYVKNAHEGNEHSMENVSYDYSSSGTTIKAKLIRNNKLRFDEVLTSDKCVYDMMSIVYYVRTLNYSSMSKNHKSQVSFLSGKKKVNMDIEYQGTENIEANDGHKYNCIKLVLMINDKAFHDKKEAMKVFITNDDNRIPIRIDSKLKVGATRVVLNKIKGNKHPIGR